MSSSKVRELLYATESKFHFEKTLADIPIPIFRGPDISIALIMHQQEKLMLYVYCTQPVYKLDECARFKLV